MLVERELIRPRYELLGKGRFTDRTSALHYKPKTKIVALPLLP